MSSTIAISFSYFQNTFQGVTSTTSRVSFAPNTNEKQKSNSAQGSASLSSKDIERDRGKPLSKYDRNVMIFDWLHTLDETATIDLT